ncbi:MAG: hypothetical protein HY907_09100 [Deltaproteobacteria bacterium]|nr:hypothetical protein [Deltaproteobacteria bacterium]
MSATRTMRRVGLAAWAVWAATAWACGDGGGDTTQDDGGEAADVSGDTESGADADVPGDGGCPADPEPPGAASCPAACSGGCGAGNVCNIDCGSDAACDGQVIDCPPEYACAVTCTGVDACDTGVVNCPPDHACSLTCDGRDGCGDLALHCGDASCAVECGSDGESCMGMMMFCGSGSCTASCAGTSTPGMDRCEESCACSGCTSGTPTYDEVAGWVAEYDAAHPGSEGDINRLTPAEVAADPEAARLLALCGADQRPVIPSLAWEYGGASHAWINPEASALVYCVYTPVSPSTDHWTYDGAADHVTADVYVLFPDENPCRDEVGAAQVTACIADLTNMEILVDTASYADGAGAGLSLAEASTELMLILTDGTKVPLWTD